MTTLRMLLTIVSVLALPLHAKALDRSLYVVNGLAETLSRVNLESGTITNNTTVLGLAPNQVYIDNVHRRDTIAYVTNSTSSDIQMVSLNTNAVIKTIPLGGGRNPYSIAFIDDTTIAVTNLLTSTLSEVDTKNGVVIGEYPVGLSPEGVVFHDGMLYVCITAFDFNTFSYGQGLVAVVDPAMDSVVATIPVGTNPQSVLVDYTDAVAVLCTGDYFSVFGQVYYIDPATHTVTDSVATGGSPGQFALSPYQIIYIAAGGWAAHGEVYMLDASSHTMIRDAANPVHVGIGATAVAADIRGFAYSCDFSADQISKIDRTGAVVETYSVGDGPGYAAVWEKWPPGDVNMDGAVSAADIIMLVSWIFKGAPLGEVWILGDSNKSCSLNASDVIRLVDFVFRSGQPVEYGCF